MSSNSGWEPEHEESLTPVASDPPAEVNATPVSASALAPNSAGPPPPENPPFGGVDVIQIGLLLFVVPIILAPFLIVIVQKFLYPQLSFGAVALKPWVLL